jgi:hypothetical protein
MDGVAQIVGKTEIADQRANTVRRHEALSGPRLEQTLYSPHAP